MSSGSSGNDLGSQPTDDGSTDASIFPAHGTGTNAVSWAPSVLATTSQNGAEKAALSPQKRFVTAGSDNLIRIWNFEESEKRWVEEEVIRGHDDWVRDVAWAPNIGLPGTFIASASQVCQAQILRDAANIFRTEPFLSIPGPPRPALGLPRLCCLMLLHRKILIFRTQSGASAGLSPATFLLSAAEMEKSVSGRRG